MNEQEQERLFEAMVELKDMLADIELDVRTAGGYYLEYDIQELMSMLCLIRESLIDYFKYGIEDKEEG